MADEYNYYDDVDDAEKLPEKEKGNPYLEDSAKGVALVARLLPTYQAWTEKQKTMKELDRLIDKRMLKTLRPLAEADIQKAGEALKKVSDQLLEKEMFPLLKGKTIIGVGGRFSSGKSRFINSCLGNKIVLPENQTPTTAIPSYLAAGEKDRCHVYLKNGQEVDIDMEAMQAMTHAFFTKYHIGFSRFVHCLVLQKKDFSSAISKNIAFLDTPGFKKPAEAMQNAASDGQIAAKELRAADYLIWLIHIDNGTIRQDDLEFLGSLHLSHPPLVVFSHADGTAESKQKEVVSEGKKVLEGAGISYYDVIAYSSQDREEYLGTHRLQDYLQEAAAYAAKNESVKNTWNQLSGRLQSAFEQEKEKLKSDKKQLQQDVVSSEDVKNILSLVQVYQEKNQRLNDLTRSLSEFSRLQDNLRQEFESMNSLREETAQ